MLPILVILTTAPLLYFGLTDPSSSKFLFPSVVGIGAAVGFLILFYFMFRKIDSSQSFNAPTSVQSQVVQPITSKEKIINIVFGLAISASFLLSFLLFIILLVAFYFLEKKGIITKSPGGVYYTIFGVVLGVVMVIVGVALFALLTSGNFSISSLLKI